MNQHVKIDYAFGLEDIYTIRVLEGFYNMKMSLSGIFQGHCLEY